MQRNLRRGGFIDARCLQDVLDRHHPARAGARVSEGQLGRQDRQCKPDGDPRLQELQHGLGFEVYAECFDAIIPSGPNGLEGIHMSEERVVECGMLKPLEDRLFADDEFLSDEFGGCRGADVVDDRE